MLSLRIKTANAFLPKEISNLRPQVPAREDTPFPESLVVPGLTIRDIRFAMLIDQMFKTEYGTTFTFSSSSYPPAEQMVSNIFRHGFCPCCALPHALHQCEKRKAYPPVKPCNVCGVQHWVTDCAVVRKKRINMEMEMEKGSEERRERRNQKIREQSAARKEKRRAERPAYRVETGANMVPWNSTSSEERDR